MIVTTTLLTTCVKLLLVPSYRSTDFEVHRNWLAITHSLPVDKWYFDDTSEWTLDYPPFFAWFEYLLSFGATYFDENMLKVDNINYASNKTVLFQRLSVIVTDLVYVYGTYRISKTFSKSWKRDVVLPILLITNCGLIMVDHIHFQYNGIMYGLLLLSVAYMLEEKYLWSSFWFAFLLNMKHIYIYLAPAYFIYLLRHFCIQGLISFDNIFSSTAFKHVAQLGSIVLSVFAASFLPFVHQIPQVFSRLFPFKRGLCHAYWAPNFWALYNTADKAATVIMPKFNIPVNTTSTASMTGGLVQEFSHTILPNILPLTTMLLTIIFMMPALVKLFQIQKNPVNFVRCMVLCGLTSFLFGWHVHEKAILMAVVPMSILSVLDQEDAKIFLILSTVGHYSLFPLLFPNSLLFIKVLLLVLYASYSFYSLHKIHLKSVCKYTLPLLSVLESLYILGLTGVFLYENVVHKILGLDSKLPFLPLMITSVYCAVGVVYCWTRYYIYFLRLDRRTSVKFKEGKKK